MKQQFKHYGYIIDVYLHTSLALTGKSMHRTQIYLQEELYGRLKARSRVLDVSISELIRTMLDESLDAVQGNAAQDFFASARPIKSFADSSPEEYVKQLRKQSRLLRKKQG